MKIHSKLLSILSITYLVNANEPLYRQMSTNNTTSTTGNYGKNNILLMIMIDLLNGNGKFWSED
jgi:hypothetical protein